LNSSLMSLNVIILNPVKPSKLSGNRKYKSKITSLSNAGCARVTSQSSQFSTFLISMYTPASNALESRIILHLSQSLRRCSGLANHPATKPNFRVALFYALRHAQNSERCLLCQESNFRSRSILP